MNETHSGWNITTAFWGLVALVFVVALGVWLWNTGNNKAELASEIQRINGEQRCMQKEVDKNTDRLDVLAPAVSRVTGQFDDFKCGIDRDVRQIFHDIYNPYALRNAACGCNNGGVVGVADGDASRYRRVDNYSLESSALQYVDICTKC